MFALGIPNTQYRRCTQVLGPERNEPIDYDVEKQNDGFYLFMFPNIDEFEFRDIVTLLKNNGITTIGADEQLTERKIMKLTDLIKEHNLINLTPLKEENFDDRLKAAGGFSDEEMDDITSRDIGSPFPGEPIKSTKASEIIDLYIKPTVKKLSDDELSKFNKEMTEYFLETIEGQATAKIFFAKREI